MTAQRKDTLTADELRKIMTYDPETGEFHRISGERAGRLHRRTGRVRVNIKNRKYLASRLAWLYVYGHWPKGEVDHKNRNKADDRFRNLREATSSQNGVNKETYARSGYKGVYRDERCPDRPWIAQLCFNGKRKHLGCFAEAHEAAAAYQQAARAMHGEFAV